MEEKNQGRWVIFAGGEVKNYDGIQRELRREDTIVCADAGLLHAQKLGIVPHIVLGDFDSYKGALPTEAEKLLLPSHKDDTDTHYAVREGLRRGFRDIMLCGALGGRPDHSFSNLCSLKAIDEAGGKGKILTDGGYITLVSDGAMELARVADAYVSIFPFGGDAVGVTLTGFAYPLTDYHMRTAVPIGVSNEQTDPVARVEVKKGTLLVMVTVEHPSER